MDYLLVAICKNTAVLPAIRGERIKTMTERFKTIFDSCFETYCDVIDYIDLMNEYVAEGNQRLAIKMYNEAVTKSENAFTLEKVMVIFRNEYDKKDIQRIRKLRERIYELVYNKTELIYNEYGIVIGIK